jgi:hypothetical protein
MSKARDISNLFSASTTAATDAEVTSAVSTHASNTTNRHYQTGTTANRPESPNVGDLYFDTTLNKLIAYTSTGWKQVLEIPDTPTNIVATASGTSVSVSFTAPTNVPVSSYVVTSSPGNITTSGSSSPITVTGLTIGTAYTFTVVAQGYNGNSATSTASNSVTPTFTVDYVVVAGGGGGGNGAQGADNGGGGGAGGMRYATGFSVSQGSAITVTVGAGGAAQASGNNSVFGTISATGGGRGAGSTNVLGANGGSGGGGGSANGSNGAGTGNAGGYTPPEGYNGSLRDSYWAGGGGGASAPGTANGGGGAGLFTALTNLAQRGQLSGGNYYLAGGGGGGFNSYADRKGLPGLGGGGTGSDYAGQWSFNATAGTTNTGGGGGGGASQGGSVPGAGGGSGIVIIKSASAATATTGSPTYTTPSGSHVYVFTASGSITF